MKNYKILLVLIVTLAVATSVFTGTNRWLSDGTEWVLLPGGGTFIPVTIVTVPPWGVPPVTTPEFNASLTGDGAVWIGTRFDGWATGGLGDYWYVRTITAIPSGAHSRMTFWGCADDRIVAVVLVSGYTSQWFYPGPSDGNDADELIRIDMSDAVITPGTSYNLWIQVNNSIMHSTGLMYYISIDYGSSSRFSYQWQAGYALHSLPFRANLSLNPRLIDIFPDALQVNYWNQEAGSYQTISPTATLNGAVGDIVRSHSIFVVHSSARSSYAYGWPIQEQRFLDIRPDIQPSWYRHIGTVNCIIPFDCPSGEPDDLSNMAIGQAWRWNQSTSNWVVVDDIETFGPGNYGTGYMILYANLPADNNAHLDLRCSPMLMALENRELLDEPPEIPDDILKTVEARAYLHVESADEETTIVDRPPTPPASFEPRDPGPPPMPPVYIPKANVGQPTESEIDIWAAPNPFNSSVEIHASIPDAEGENVEITIFDINGRKIKELLPNLPTLKGEYTFLWDGKDEKGVVSSTGIYYYKMVTGNIKLTGTVLLVK